MALKDYGGFVNAGSALRSLIPSLISPRIRVDVGQTGFFDKREFEANKEFATATTGTYVLRVVSPINFIVMEIGIEAEAGECVLRTFSGGTPTGTFSETITQYPANTMDTDVAAYTPQMELSAIPSGGSLAGGTQIRVSRVKAADIGNFSQTVGRSNEFIAGRAAGTYYATLAMTNFIGVLNLRFEERP